MTLRVGSDFDRRFGATVFPVHTKCLLYLMIGAMAMVPGEPDMAKKNDFEIACPHTSQRIIPQYTLSSRRFKPRMLQSAPMKACMTPSKRISP